MIISLLCIGTGILIWETLLWKLFYSKSIDTHFPPSLDTSSIRFFSVPRMRIAVGVHGGLLLLSTLLPLWLLW